ncbi:hypothetical protein [Neobacillus vireti]|uniref:hypothetical protein n=1 Tax=Neobacillus vireti TaxID=220686 RepID=UPI0030009F93
MLKKSPIDKNVPRELINLVMDRLEQTLPYKCRGIKITHQLIQVTLECLNEEPSKTLPQNCRNDVRSRTPDGLDYRIKNRMGSDLRTANIISDILAEAGIVKITHIINPKTGRSIKASQLLKDWTW